MPTVKAVDKPLSRAERARETRQRMVGSAHGLFIRQGYAATTMEQIATVAGVAVQTIYYTFRTKARLLCEVVEVAGASQHDPAPVMQRSWMVETLSTRSADRALALAVEHGTDIYARVAPLRPALAAAAAIDAYVEEYAQGIATARRAGMERLVVKLTDLGSLRPGLEKARATDVLFVLDSHETFLGLTRDAGWTVPAFKAWLFVTLRQQLLKPRRLNPAATRDLSYHSLLEAA